MKTYIILILAGIVFAIVVALISTRCAASPPPVGATASASLVSSNGDDMGSITFTQTDAGLLIAAELSGLAPGGHALVIHEVGACTPDFTAAGDHFAADYGLIHPVWQQRSGTLHEGDLPNIYAASDGSARVDFFTDNVTLDADAPHSVFDPDGSSIIVYEKPSDYTEDEDYGDLLACGVIQKN